MVPTGSCTLTANFWWLVACKGCRGLKLVMRDELLKCNLDFFHTSETKEDFYASNLLSRCTCELQCLYEVEVYVESSLSFQILDSEIDLTPVHH